MELIAVIMKGETADKRNTDAKALLNYGFSTYALVSAAPEGTGAYAGWAHSCKNVGMASASTTVSVRPSADAVTFSRPVP